MLRQQLLDCRNERLSLLKPYRRSGTPLPRRPPQSTSQTKSLGLRQTFLIPSTRATSGSSYTARNDSKSEETVIDDGQDLPVAQDDSNDDCKIVHSVTRGRRGIVTGEVRHLKTCDSIQVLDRQYQAGSTVEFRDDHFMKVVYVAENERHYFNKATYFIGYELCRARSQGSAFPLESEELIWMATPGADLCKGTGDHRSRSGSSNLSHLVSTADGHTFAAEALGLCVRSTEEVKDHRSILFTNSMSMVPPHPRTLICRWKMSAFFNATGRRIGETIEKLSHEETDCAAFIDPRVLRYEWRGQTQFGGSRVNDEVTFNVDTGSEESFRSQSYTMIDTFCGGGGLSEGARQAGVTITWAVDMNSDATDTYRLNAEPRTIVRTQSIDEFLLEARLSGYRADMLHISPPCVLYSPAKTVAAETDEANEEALYAVEDLLKCFRPRVVTLEQTFGMTHTKHAPAFNKLLSFFVSSGYSVRWQLLNCVEFGVPQKRNRLIIIAAGPGEVLPDFPKPTTSPDGGSLPKTKTLQEVFDDIPAHATHQELSTPATEEYARTMTTSGGGAKYSIRQFASLQGFPSTYVFPQWLGKTRLRRVIGNAVPPPLGKVLYEKVIASLQATDAANDSAVMTWNGHSPVGAIEIED